MSFYEKYLKYKSKYLNLKNIIAQNAGANDDNISISSEDSITQSKLLVVPYMKDDFNWGHKADHEKWGYFQRNDKVTEGYKLIDELEYRMSKHRKITLKQATIYVRAIEGLYANHTAHCKTTTELCTKCKTTPQLCANHIVNCKPNTTDENCKKGAKLFILGTRLYNDCIECQNQTNFLKINAPNLDSHIKDRKAKLHQIAGSSENDDNLSIISDNLSTGSDESEATKAKLLVTPYTKSNFNWTSNKESEKWSYFQKSNNIDLVNGLIKELQFRMNKYRKITPEQSKVYIRALEASYYNHGRKCVSAKQECADEARVFVLAKKFAKYNNNNKELIKSNAQNLYGHMHEGLNYHKKQSGGSSESNSLTHLSSTPNSPNLSRAGSPNSSRSSSPKSPRSPKKEILLIDNFIGKDWNFFHNGNGMNERTHLMYEITNKVFKNHISLNDIQLKTYLSVLEAEFLRANHECTSDCAKKSSEVTKLFSALKQNYPKVNNIINEGGVAPSLVDYLKGNRGFGGLKKQAGGNIKKEIYLFKAEWCPHCISLKPTWKKLEKEFSNKYTFITFDSDKDKTSIQKWDIKGFPTIIKKTGNDMEEYIGPRDEESIKTFITAD